MELKWEVLLGLREDGELPCEIISMALLGRERSVQFLL